jgi:hypothetical protein
MSITLESSTPRRFEDVIRLVADMGGLGSLADDVVMDSIRVESGRMKASDSVALTTAARAFRSVIDTDSAAPDQWTGAIDGLHFQIGSFSSVAALVPEGPASDDLVRWFEKIVDALDNVIAGNRGEDLQLVEGEFTRLAQSTLAAARDITESRSFAHAWAE